MEIRLQDVPPDSRAAVMDFVSEYEDCYLSGRKQGLRNGVVWRRGSGTIVVYHTKTSIVLRFLPQSIT